MPKIQAVQCLLRWSESNWAFNSFQRSEIIPHPKSLSCTHSKLLLQALLPLYPRHSPNALTWRPQLDATGRRGSIIYFHQHVVCVSLPWHSSKHPGFPKLTSCHQKPAMTLIAASTCFHFCFLFPGGEGSTCKSATSGIPRIEFDASDAFRLSGRPPCGFFLTTNLWEQFFEVFRNENTNKIVCNKAEHVTDSLQVCIFGCGLALKHHYNRCARTRFDM